MAQRTIHYLFGEMISRQIKLKDKQRFLLGSILPDAIDRSYRNASHFKVKTDICKYFDFTAFRNQYFDLMRQDDLYFGYYMHLVEDAFYRTFFFNNGFTMPKTKEEVAVLHHDYNILNAYIVNKYHLRNILEGTFSLDEEPVSQIAPFHIDAFLQEMARDFTEQIEGTPVYVTVDMLDNYVKTYLPLAIEEAKNIQDGCPILNAAEYCWPAKR